MATSSTKSRERVARNFIRSYGRSRFRRLLEALAANESGQIIADEFGVSRERVRQWKNTFGTVITLYQVHPEVERILRERRAIPEGGAQQAAPGHGFRLAGPASPAALPQTLPRHAIAQRACGTGS